MKSVIMKGKNVEEATRAAAEVLSVDKEKLSVRVISEGKAGLMGILGGEEAEIEAKVIEAVDAEAREILQTILDKMGFLAIAEAKTNTEGISLDVRGEDMGRIIGKEGAMLKALEIVVCSILWKLTGERVRVSVDAGDYKEKRNKALERLAADVATEVEQTGVEKAMPPMPAGDRRIIHLFLQEKGGVTTYSRGEGKERQLIVAPKK